MLLVLQPPFDEVLLHFPGLWRALYTAISHPVVWEALEFIERSAAFWATLADRHLVFLVADFGTERSVIEVEGLAYKGLIATETSIFGS